MAETEREKFERQVQEMEARRQAARDEYIRYWISQGLTGSEAMQKLPEHLV